MEEGEEERKEMRGGDKEGKVKKERRPGEEEELETKRGR